MIGQRDLMVSGAFAEGLLGVDSFQGRERLSTPFEYSVVLRSDSPNIDISTFVGDTLTVSVDLPSGNTRYFNGYVTRMALQGVFEDHAQYLAILRPWLFLMSSRINSRIFQNKSVTDIAKAIFREHGFSDFEDALSNSYPVRDFVVQYRESDFNFVCRLFEHVGIYYYFKHEEARHVLVLADSRLPTRRRRIRGSTHFIRTELPRHGG